MSTAHQATEPTTPTVKKWAASPVRTEVELEHLAFALLISANPIEPKTTSRQYNYCSFIGSATRA